MTKNQGKIFVSYSAQDSSSEAVALARSLSAAGLKVWLDRWSLVPGEAWSDVADNALDEASIVIALVGAGGLSPWQNHELRASKLKQAAKQQRIIPVLLPGAKPNLGDVPALDRRFGS
jgi:hypothetical protein